LAAKAVVRYREKPNRHSALSYELAHSGEIDIPLEGVVNLRVIRFLNHEVCWNASKILDVCSCGGVVSVAGNGATFLHKQVAQDVFTCSPLMNREYVFEAE